MALVPGLTIRGIASAKRELWLPLHYNGRNDDGDDRDGVEGGPTRHRNDARQRDENDCRDQPADTIKHSIVCCRLPAVCPS